MKTIQRIIFVLFFVHASVNEVKANGDLEVTGMTMTTDLAIIGLNCTANSYGGALTTDSSGVVYCSNDDNATGPVGPAGPQGPAGPAGPQGPQGPSGVVSFATNNTRGGTDALVNPSGDRNTAFGVQALKVDSSGSDNTAIGYRALTANTSGLRNVAVGKDALLENISGDDNVALGNNALFHNLGNDNVAIGRDALYNINQGTGNIAIGDSAGRSINSKNNNITIGHSGTQDDSGIIRIGTSGTHTKTYIAGVWGTPITNPSLSVLANSSGQLGTIASSARYKQDVADMNTASDALLDLRPVTFRYIEPAENGEQPIQYGLIAEEVASVFPDLVVHNSRGQVETVKYHLLSTLLLNELQKQHTLNQMQNTRIQQQFKALEQQVLLNQQQAAELTRLRAMQLDIDQLKTQMTELSQRSTLLAGRP